MGYIKSTELLFLVVFVVGASTLGTQSLPTPMQASFIRPPSDLPAWALRRHRAHRSDPRADPDRRPGLAAAAAGAELHGDRSGRPMGVAAVMLINHRLSASTDHYDATLETVPSKAVTVTL